MGWILYSRVGRTVEASTGGREAREVSEEEVEKLRR